MTVNPESFRQAMSRFASGVTVVTAKTHGGAPVGVTVSAFSSLSLTPPLILVCLDNATANLAAYSEGPGFCVNILAAGQEDASNAFAFPGPVPPFERIDNVLGALNIPILTGTVATLECTRFAVHPGGDHQILIGQVEHAAWRTDVAPLLYAAGGYRALAGSTTGSDVSA